MNKRPPFLRAVSAEALGVFCLSTLALTGLVVGDDLEWDNSDSDPGADFVWDDQGNTNWSLDQWDNAVPDNAIFGAAGVGTITLGEAIRAGNLTFNTDGYTITGDTLNFGVADPRITLAAGVTATIDSNSASDTRDLEILFVNNSELVLGGADMDFDSIDMRGTTNSGTLTIASGADVTVDGNSNGGSGEQNFGVRLGNPNMTLVVDGILNATSVGSDSPQQNHTYVVNAGGELNANNLTFGWNGNSTVTVNGGALNVTGTLQHTDGGVGTLNFLGGVSTINKIRSNTFNGSMVVNFDGGIVKASSSNLFLHDSSKDNLAAHNIGDNGAIIDVDGNAVTSVQEFNTSGTNLGGLTLRSTAGGGSLIFTGGNATADTTVEGGTLNLSYTERATVAASGAVSDFYDPSSNLILDGGNFSLTGRAGSDGVTREMRLNPINNPNNTFIMTGSVADVIAGASVSGTGIAAGTYVTNISGTNQVFLSNAIVGNNNTLQSITFGAVDDTTTQTINSVELQQSATISVNNNGGAGTTLSVGSLNAVTGNNLNKAGNGTLVLTGDNSASFTSIININGGVLRVTSDGALGGAGIIENRRVSVNTGAALELEGGITNTTKFIRLNGTGVGATGAIRNVSGSNTFTNSRVNLNTAGSIGVDTGSTLEFSGGAGITKENAAAARDFTKVGGGTLVMNNVSASGNSHFGGAINLEEGTLTVSGGNANFLTLSSGVVTGAGTTFNINHTGSHSYTGVISGDGTLNKNEAGVFTFEGDNTYKGATAVNAGTLIVNGNSSAADGAVTVASGATLGGGGTVGGATIVNSGGTLTGGTNGDVGTLAFSGDLEMETGSTWLVDLVNDSTSSDQVNVGGSLTLAGALSINEVSGVFGAGSVYDIASYSGLSGTFSNASTDGAIITSGGGSWRVNYGTVTANTITLTAVPEPGVVIPLLLLLSAGFVSIRRKRQASVVTD